MQQSSHTSAPDYGMGWIVDPHGIRHDGDTANYHSHIRINTEEKWGLIFLCNANDYLIPAFDHKASAMNRIPEQVARIINDKAVMDKPALGYKGIYLIINLILLTWLLVLLYKTIFLKKWITSLKKKNARIRISVSIIFLYFVFPIFLIKNIPVVFGTPGPILRLFAPGVGHMLFLLPLYMILIGIIKFIILTLKRE